MTDGLSAADVMALSNNENNWMNNPFIYLVWMWMFGANGWNRNNDAAMQGALTRSDLFEGFYAIRDKFNRDCKYDKEDDILWS